MFIFPPSSMLRSSEHLEEWTSGWIIHRNPWGGQEEDFISNRNGNSGCVWRLYMFLDSIIFSLSLLFFCAGNFRMKSSCIKARSPRVILVKCSDSLNAAWWRTRLPRALLSYCNWVTYIWTSSVHFISTLTFSVSSRWLQGAKEAERLSAQWGMVVSTWDAVLFTWRHTQHRNRAIEEECNKQHWHSWELQCPLHPTSLHTGAFLKIQKSSLQEGVLPLTPWWCSHVLCLVFRRNAHLQHLCWRHCNQPGLWHLISCQALHRYGKVSFITGRSDVELLLAHSMPGSTLSSSLPTFFICVITAVSPT